MTLKDILGKFSSVAPNLAAVASLIPGGQIPAAIIGMLGSAFGGATDQEIANNIAKDPEAAMKLKQMDIDHAEFIIEKQNEAMQSAYTAQASTQQWITSMQWFFGGIAIYLGLIFLIVLVASMCFNIDINPAENKLITLIGGLLTGFLGAFLGLAKLQNK